MGVRTNRDRDTRAPKHATAQYNQENGKGQRGWGEDGALRRGRSAGGGKGPAVERRATEAVNLGRGVNSRASQRDCAGDRVLGARGGRDEK